LHHWQVALKIKARPKTPNRDRTHANDTVGNWSIVTCIIGGRLHVRTLANDTFGHQITIFLPDLSSFSHLFSANSIIPVTLQNWTHPDDTFANFIEQSYLHRWRACPR
jgi:hypothetical protein